jgi:hypothetical protein
LTSAWWHTCYPSIREAEAGGQKVWGQPRLHIKLQVSLDPFSKQERQRTLHK